MGGDCPAVNGDSVICQVKNCIAQARHIRIGRRTLRQHFRAGRQQAGIVDRPQDQVQPADIVQRPLLERLLGMFAAGGNLCRSGPSARRRSDEDASEMLLNGVRVR